MPRATKARTSRRRVAGVRRVRDWASRPVLQWVVLILPRLKVKHLRSQILTVIVHLHYHVRAISCLLRLAVCFLQLGPFLEELRLVVWVLVVAANISHTLSYRLLLMVVLRLAIHFLLNQEVVPNLGLLRTERLLHIVLRLLLLSQEGGLTNVLARLRCTLLLHLLEEGHSSWRCTFLVRLRLNNHGTVLLGGELTLL